MCGCKREREREKGLRERVCEREGEPPEFVLSEREKNYYDKLNVALCLEFRPLMHTEERGDNTARVNYKPSRVNNHSNNVYNTSHRQAKTSVASSLIDL